MTTQHHPQYRTAEHPTTPGLYATRCVVCGEGPAPSRHRPLLEQWKKAHLRAATTKEKS